MTKECHKCSYYKAFYRKGLSGFWLERQGVCCESKSKVVKENFSCANWKLYEKTLFAIEALDSEIVDIKDLEKIYQNDDKDY